MVKGFIRTAQRYRSRIPTSERAQGMAEYGLILAGVAMMAIVAIFLVGAKIGNLMNVISPASPETDGEDLTRPERGASPNLSHCGGRGAIQPKGRGPWCRGRA